MSVADGWLELDGVALADLPAWAQSPSDPSRRVILSEHGLAWIDGKRGVVAPWSDVLGVVVREADDVTGEAGTVYVLVPRTPPLAPWLAVVESALPADEARDGLAAFAKRVLARSRQSGYRAVAQKGPLLPRSELVRRVLAHLPIPGAVEVPVGPGPREDGHGKLGIGTALGTIGGGVGGAMAGSALLGATLGPAGVLVAAAVCAALVGGVVTFYDSFQSSAMAGRTSRPRVLVLAPDGCVVGFADGVRGFSWDQVGRFVAGSYALATGDEQRDCLEVRAHDDVLVGRIDASWFDGPLELIVGIAEAYRRRATES